MNEFVIELKGLGCPNCASKIEHDIQKVNGIKEANMNFPNQTILIELDKAISIDTAIEQITKIVHNHESEVMVSLKNNLDKKSKSHSHEHKHDQSYNDEMNETKTKFIRFGIGILIFALAIFIDIAAPFKLLIFIVAYAVFGGDVVITALKNILKGDFFDENFLMTIATLGAFAIGDYPEAVAVMLFYQIGEILQDLAVGRSRKSIRAIMDIRPDFANKITVNGTEKVEPSVIQIGDYILVKPGEKIPLDGVIEDGNSQLDTKALTGESVPRTVNIGDEVLSGCINQSGLLKIKVTKSFGESTVTKILELVENASARKAPTEKFITKFARYYTPAVVLLALAVAIIPPLITPEADFTIWLSRALIMLVISCPCAIVVSIPLGFFSGIGIASSKGILIKGSNYLQALNEVNTVVFDKTGTLTEGVFEVIETKAEDGYKNDLLKYTAIAEYHSTHPIAKSIIAKYNLANEKIDEKIIESYEEIAGYGVKVLADGKTILVGNIKLMNKEGMLPQKANSVGTVVYTSIDGIYAGYIVISDKLKKDSKQAIKSLNELGIKDTVMLTGDREITAKDIANKIGISKVYSELLPAQKVEKLEEISKQNQKGKVIFVGDGINDAPVLARADIGIAMGGAGSDAAVEAADIVIMHDEPSKIAEAIKIAKHTNKIVWQNIIFALGVKAIFLIMGGLGFANMWLAVFADVGVTLIAVLNSMRKG